MYGLHTTWRWVASLAGVCHFLTQRLADDAQRETHAYAQAVYALVRPLFPESMASLVRQVPAVERGPLHWIVGEQAMWRGHWYPPSNPPMHREEPRA